MSGANINCPSPAREARRPWIGAAVRLTIRYLLGAVFLMAAISKIVSLRDFENQILLHSTLPQALSNIPMSLRAIRIAVLFLPWLELTCGLCLIFGRAVRESAVIVSILLSLFIVLALVSRTNDDCHCFFFPRMISGLPWWWHPARDGVLLIGSIYLVFKASPKTPNSDSLG